MPTVLHTKENTDEEHSECPLAFYAPFTIF